MSYGLLELRVGALERRLARVEARLELNRSAENFGDTDPPKIVPTPVRPVQEVETAAPQEAQVSAQNSVEAAAQNVAPAARWSGDLSSSPTRVLPPPLPPSAQPPRAV